MSVLQNKLVIELIVDALLDKKLKVNKAGGYKKGFFASYKKLYGKQKPEKGDRILITEVIAKDIIKKGKNEIVVPSSAIITPLARFMLEENGIIIR